MTNELKKYKTSLIKAIEALAFIDFYQQSKGWSRQVRRKFWRNFVASPAWRKDYMERLKDEVKKSDTDTSSFQRTREDG